MGAVGTRNGPRVFLTGHRVSKVVLNARRRGFVDMDEAGIKEVILASRREFYELKAEFIELTARWHGGVDNGSMQLFQRDDDFYSNAGAMEAMLAFEREFNEFKAYFIEQRNLIRREVDALIRCEIEASKDQVPADQIEPGVEMPLKTQKKVTKRGRDEASKKTRKMRKITKSDAKGKNYSN